MDLIAILHHPAAVWGAGLLVLTCTLFVFARHKYLTKKRTLLSVLDKEDEKWRQRAVMSSELLEKFEKRAKELLAEHARLDEHIAAQRKGLQGLVDDAGKAMQRLGQLIESFDKTFYEDRDGHSSISEIFEKVQADFAKRLETMVAEHGFVSPGDSNEAEARRIDDRNGEDGGRKDDRDDEDNEDDEREDDMFDGLDEMIAGLSAEGMDGPEGSKGSKPGALREKTGVSEGETAKVASNATGATGGAACGRQVRRLLEQNKTPSEIARELKMNEADVELIVHVLAQNRKVA